MLVLTRKVGERIQIGNDVVLVVSRIQGDRVRLGIAAPAHVAVLRAELRERNPAGAPDAAAGSEAPRAGRERS